MGAGKVRASSKKVDLNPYKILILSVYIMTIQNAYWSSGSCDSQFKLDLLSVLSVERDLQSLGSNLN